MKKLIACLLALALVLALGACGSSGSYETAEVGTENYAEGDYAAEAYTDEVYTDNGTWDSQTGSASTAATSEETSDESYLSGLKIIKTGNMSLQTEDYDQTDSMIRARINEYQGILAETSVSGTEGERYANYTVRIPADSFDSFFYDITGSSVVTYQAISSEDVTDQYTDLSTRLETDQKKYERLLELLDKAETLTDIYSIQSEISDVEYEIDEITGTLNGLDARVSYSTIYIDVTETTHAVAVPEEQSFGAKLRAALKNGTAGAAESLQSFVLFAAGNWFGLLICLLLVAAVIVLARRFARKERTKREAWEAQKAQNAGYQQPVPYAQSPEEKPERSEKPEEPEEN